ncbi:MULTISPECIES: archease [unclassified Halorhabdus]|uniref:archease n=1 Tax=unclassified Halorhabdus TaxID=2621901 RepID=UPI0023DA4B2D|nr:MULTISPECIES: archease [unclassified Halorhabdus]WEL17986.1 SHS2 domain protein implicated in nucleic acid metabolism [Halorhabdus sp. SVX81]WEL21868.1 SHS2 domain protein implicated in nucleic acid metabolism [Halorhabdus sp. BNX81]
MSFDLREHTADVAVESTGETLGDAFGATADGLAAAMCADVPRHGERFEVDVSAESRESALFDYLDELIYQRDMRGVLPVDNRATVDRTGDDWHVRASARGVPLDAISAREVKAVTYSEMVLEATDEGWHAYVVFDV